MLCVLFFFYLFFFFQAEDGIRDLVRSRGLGDVYKRQAIIRSERRAFRLHLITFYFHADPIRIEVESGVVVLLMDHIPVSYTHLTLPTSDLV